MRSKSLTTIEGESGDGDLLPLVCPGEILLEEFLKPLGMSQYRLAHSIGVPPRRINEIVHGTRAITADTALRLSRFFGTTARFWMSLQSDYELRAAERSGADAIMREIAPLVRAG